MRSVQTFILRLLVDPAMPDELRGAVEPVPKGDSRPFAGEQALLALLHQMALPRKSGASSETTGNGSEKCVEGREP
jgi:hypothetical protein